MAVSFPFSLCFTNLVGRVFWKKSGFLQNRKKADKAFNEKIEMRLTYRGIQVKSVLNAGYLVIVLSQRGKLIFARVNPNKFDELNWEQAIGKDPWTMPIFSKNMSY